MKFQTECVSRACQNNDDRCGMLEIDRCGTHEIQKITKPTSMNQTQHDDKCWSASSDALLAMEVLFECSVVCVVFM